MQDAEPTTNAATFQRPAWSRPATEAVAGMHPDRDDEVLVIGYLSAVAAALDERGIAVRALRLGEQSETLSGTLVLHSGFRAGLTEATWSEETGWSADLCCGINGHRITRRYLDRESVPAPVVAAGFIAALAAGRAAGDLAPALFPDHLRDGHQQLINQLSRFAVPDPTRFTDAYLFAVTDLIERKHSTGDATAAPTATGPDGGDSMTYLLTALQRSVEAARMCISGSGFPAAEPSIPTQRGATHSDAPAAGNPKSPDTSAKSGAKPPTKTAAQ